MWGAPRKPWVGFIRPGSDGFPQVSPGRGPPRPVAQAPRGGGWAAEISLCSCPAPVVFPARTISTCPSTSRPASCSVGRGAPAPSCRGSPGYLPPSHPLLDAPVPRGPD